VVVLVAVGVEFFAQLQFNYYILWFIKKRTKQR